MRRGEGRRRGKRKGINQWSDHFQGTPFGAEKYKISCLDKRYNLHLLNTQLQLKTLLSCSYVVTNSLLNINTTQWLAEGMHFCALLCPRLPSAVHTPAKSLLFALHIPGQIQLQLGFCFPNSTFALSDSVSTPPESLAPASSSCILPLYFSVLSGAPC